MWGCRQGRGGELKTEGRAGSPGLCSERRGSGQAHRCWTAGPQDAGSLSPTVGVTWSPAPEGGPRFPTLSAPRGRTQGGPVVWPWAPALLSCGGAVCALPTASPTGRALQELGALLAAPRNWSRPALCEGKGGQRWSLPHPQHDLSRAAFLLGMGGGGPWGPSQASAPPGAPCSLSCPSPAPHSLRCRTGSLPLESLPRHLPWHPETSPPPHPHDTIMLLTPSLSSVLHTFPLTAPSRI